MSATCLHLDILVDDFIDSTESGILQGIDI
jgi:hypothetical protein